MKNKYVTPVLFTLISLGPVGWFFIDLSTGRTDRLAFLYIVTILAAVIATIMWIGVLTDKASE